MAEQEVVKHTKKIFSVWGGDKSFWHKLKEFLLEIIIIVFAISLSIYLHDRSEKKHLDHETKEFLLGLREDLRTDTAEMQADKFSFTQSGIAFNYMWTRKMHEPLSKDTINKYYNWIFNTTGLIPNSGRFEGFKSSGKIGNIKDRELQDDIMDLYQEDIPNLIVSTNGYTAQKQKLFTYVEMNEKRITDSTSSKIATLSTDPAYNMCRGLVYVKEILGRYDSCIHNMNKIMDAINKEYGK